MFQMEFIKFETLFYSTPKNSEEVMVKDKMKGTIFLLKKSYK